MDEVFDAELMNRNKTADAGGSVCGARLVNRRRRVYAVLSYTVAQRTAEIGVRMALGAQRSTVVMEVVRGALFLTASGIVLGLVGAFAVSRLLTSWLFSVSPVDPPTFAATALLLTVMAGVASYVPARRSANVDPSPSSERSER